MISLSISVLRDYSLRIDLLFLGACFNSLLTKLRNLCFFQVFGSILLLLLDRVSGACLWVPFI